MIVHFADLHNSEFGTKNERLITQVARQNPDLILITGDLIDSDSKNTEIAVTLIEGLSEIAPAYLSFGNHEQQYEENYDIDLSMLLKMSVLLDSICADVIVNGQKMWLGGEAGYCLPADSEAAKEDETVFLENFQNTDSFKVLLAHMPLAWYYSGSTGS